ncbi:MAG: diaminopimelate decarboxylase [Clostridia bacterium]
MLITDISNVNEKGNLTLGGADCVTLAEKFGTPLIAYNEDEIIKNCNCFKNSIDKYYNGNGLVCYASKAFCCKQMIKTVTDCGLGLDVVSGGELYTALKAGANPENICFHGNNKTPDELLYALKENVGRIVVDNLTELDLLNTLSKSVGKKVKILFRIKPGIDAHTHDFIRTGQIDSKFGLALENGEAFEAVKKAIELDNILLSGLHCHIGSQIFDIEPFVLAAQVMMNFIAKIKNELNFVIEELNLGGGFGIKYTENDKPVGYDKYMEQVSDKIKQCCKSNGTKLPFIIIEPGRSIAGPCGITLYKIGNIKKIKDVRTYVAVDGGMCDNPRYALYKSEYSITVANKAGLPKAEKVTIAGKCCESGDLIQENILIQAPCEGDVLAVGATGAYNYSMASNYNRIPKPAVVFIKDGIAREVIKRESFDDLIKNDL